jgi:hypothetical protein
MTPAGAGLEPAEPPCQGENNQKWQEEECHQKVAHPITRSLRRVNEDNGAKRQNGAETEQRGHAPGGTDTFADGRRHGEETPGHIQVVLYLSRNRRKKVTPSSTCHSHCGRSLTRHF